MAVEVTCDGCGKRLKGKDSYAGRSTRCPVCRGPITFPPLTPDFDPDEAAEEIRHEADFPDFARPEPIATRARPVPPLGPEPWYYGALHLYAKLIVTLGVVQFPILLLIGVNMATTGREPVETAGAVIGMSFGFLIGSILGSAPLLMAVDIARNIRAIRHNTSAR